MNIGRRCFVDLGNFKPHNELGNAPTIALFVKPNPEDETYNEKRSLKYRTYMYASRRSLSYGTTGQVHN